MISLCFARHKQTIEDISCHLAVADLLYSPALGRAIGIGEIRAKSHGGG